MDEDSFFELLTRFQSRRIDDQRCSFRLLESAPATPAHPDTKSKDLASLGTFYLLPFFSEDTDVFQ